ncbi:MAG: tellurite resistance TerB family protein [Cyanobacteriota bacterium]
MNPTTQHRLMLKIVAGSAWADGHLEPQELAYLGSLLRRYNLEHDTELGELFQQPIPAKQTELWMAEYLMEATETERMQLLGAIGNLLIADNHVSSEEHSLLDEYHALMAGIPAQPESAPSLVKSVGQFFRRIAKAVSG